MKLNNNDDSHNSGLNLLIYNMLLDIESHPAWVCGLKHPPKFRRNLARCHTLRGCVDWNHIANVCDIANVVTPCVGVWIETISILSTHVTSPVTPCVGVWIETGKIKLLIPTYCRHTLRGCVDWNIGRLIIRIITKVTPCVGVWIETDINFSLTTFS